MLKKLIALVCLLSLGDAADAQTFGGKTIGQLPNANPSLLQQTDLLPMERGGVTYHALPFRMPASGGLLVSNNSLAPLGIPEVDGECAIGIGGVWSTSACITGPNINIAGSVTASEFIPTSSTACTNCFYLPSAGTPGINAGGAPVIQFPTVGSSVDFWQLKGGPTGTPGFISSNAVGSDGQIGIVQNSKGTTTAGFQYNGNVASVSGDQFFDINGVPALRLTDTYANVNAIYPGAVNGWPVLSSAWGDGTSTTDAFAGMLSVEAPSLYPGHLVSGLTLLIGSKGPSGEIHFVGNGAIGHVSVDPPQGTNPNGADQFAGNNSLRLRGSFTGSGFDATISTQFWDVPDTHTGILFFNEGDGGFGFKTDNTATDILELKKGAVTGGDGSRFTNQAIGTGPLLQAQSSGSNAPFNISGKGTGGVNLTGTSTNNVAGAGIVGQVIASSIPSGSAVALTTSTAKDVTSISLTPGNWFICANVAFFANAATTATGFAGGITTTTNTLPTPPDGYAQFAITVPAAGSEPEFSTGCVVKSLASTTTVFLDASASFAVNTMSAFGNIVAHRIY